MDQDKTARACHLLSLYVSPPYVGYYFVDIFLEIIYNTFRKAVMNMKNFFTVLATIVGVFTAVAAALLIIDRLVYNNGPKSGYISCECEEDAE